MPERDPEDEKLVVLARSTRARSQAEEGAAVRDTDGRTYTASSVSLPSLELTALQAAVVAAVSSGAEEVEAAVVVTDRSSLSESSVQVVRDLSGAAPILRVDTSGVVQETLTGGAEQQ